MSVRHWVIASMAVAISVLAMGCVVAEVEEEDVVEEVDDGAASGSDGGEAEEDLVSKDAAPTMDEKAEEWPCRLIICNWIVE